MPKRAYPDVPPIGKKLEDLRVQHHLTGAEMGRMFGVEPMTFYRWRDGITTPSWTDVLQFSAKFDRRPEWFYTPTKAMQNGHALPPKS